VYLTVGLCFFFSSIAPSYYMETDGLVRAVLGVTALMILVPNALAVGLLSTEDARHWLSLRRAR
jgi:hypothetical protein